MYEEFDANEIIESEPENLEGWRFKDWLGEVDAAIDRVCGLSHRDLADVDFRYMWEDGCSPEEAAIGVLRENGYPEEMLAEMDLGF